METSYLDELAKLTTTQLCVSIVISVLVYLFFAYALGKVFKKAGEKVWKAFVPIYNAYIMCKICWETKYFWRMLVAEIVASCLNPELYGIKDEALVLILSLLTLVVSIYALVLSIKLMFRLSKSFGHGAGYCVGLLLLPIVFVPVLGFGESKYVGNANKNDNV